MNIALKNNKHSWFITLCLLAILAIIACNLWLLSNGHCMVSDYLKIPVMGWIVIVANIVAVMALFSIKRHKQTRSDGGYCHACQIALRKAWVYCPNCGGDRVC